MKVCLRTFSCISFGNEIVAFIQEFDPNSLSIVVIFLSEALLIDIV